MLEIKGTNQGVGECSKRKNQSNIKKRLPIITKKMMDGLVKLVMKKENRKNKTLSQGKVQLHPMNISMIGTKGMKAILILMPHNRMVHNRLLFKVIKRRGELSPLFKMIPCDAPLMKKMLGEAYVELYKHKFKQLDF